MIKHFCTLVLLTTVVSANAQTPVVRLKYGAGKELAKLANKAINESSGLAASPAHRGVFWTHNDSGSKPLLYAFNKKGQDLATVTVTGASARDWEDMSSFSYRMISSRLSASRLSS